ncbi:Piso0_001333 [Millerozyma farinosa CBS 7064]|uniref:Piso0_001333 protein n=1 Tax=Pichia sorbitophila (strain ATCC MYA-4447 / BCRC 22081 / CBS 7064 / NBRC 10061 / NRRL Y-12695) TaxID=559304 RepID=G8YMW1_PICSO|nr:Piso0_001333 [Millerozyma farinosa CBS 7064]
MGKLKRASRSRNARLNPLGYRRKECSAEASKSSSKDISQLLPVLNNLKSPSESEKLKAITTLSIYINNEEIRKFLLKEKVIALAFEHCFCDDLHLVSETLDFLKCLLIEEGPGIGKYYWRLKIWNHIKKYLSSLESFFEKIVTRTEDSGDAPTQENNLTAFQGFAENMISFIIVLAVGSEELFNNVILNIDNVLAHVSKLINWNITSQGYSNDLFNCFLEFLFEFSTESRDFIEKLSESPDVQINSILDFLETDRQNSNILGKVYGDGIRFNYYEGIGQIKNKDEASLFILDNTIQHITSIDLNTLRSAQSETVKQSNGPDLSRSLKQLNSTRNEAEALSVGIDVITSIFEYLSYDDSGTEEPIVLSPDLENHMLKNVFPCLDELLDFASKSDESLFLASKIVNCFNNLCWLFLSCDHIPTMWFNSCLKLWDSVIFVSSRTEDIEIHRDCLNVLWALSKCLGGTITSKVSDDMVRSIITKCQSIISGSQGDLEFVLCSVGFLGTVALHINDIEVTRSISSFLLALIHEFIGNKNLKNDINQIDIILESLNSIYDIFGDKSYSYDYEIFVKEDYISKLESLYPEIKRMYKTIDKNKHRHLKVKAEETYINLERFIKYKKQERQ